MKTLRESYRLESGAGSATLAAPAAAATDAAERPARDLRSLWLVLAEHLRTRARVRAAVRELQAYDDRALNDIGITRTDIRRVVEGTSRARVGRLF